MNLRSSRTGTAQLRIIGVSRDPENNDLGSANVNFVVIINRAPILKRTQRGYNRSITMAISRNQLVKELEPGLNALFGLEYKQYEQEHAEIYTLSHLTELLKKKLCYQVSLKHKLNQKVLV